MTTARRDPQLLKGVLPMLVLHLLAERESYGYELVTRLQDDGLADIATGTVYPVLNRLERDGLIASRLVASPHGPARKYYLPTPDGAARLAEARSGWDQLAEVVAGVTARPLPATPVPAPSSPPPSPATNPEESR